jgi:ribosomal protein S20
MPIIKSAVKRMKQTIKRRERNVAVKRDVKGAVKAFLEKPTAAGLSAAQSEIDTAVKKNLLSKNTAARRKANLAKVAKEAGVKVEASAAKAPATKAAPKATAKPAVTKAPAKATTAKKPAAKKPAAAKAPAKKAAPKK